MIKYNPNEEDSPTNQIYAGTGGNSGVPNFTVVTWGGETQRQHEQEQYIVNNITQGTHSSTTGNKLNNGTDTSSFTVTVGNYNNVNSSRVGDNVLGVDRVENTHTKPSGFTRIMTGLGNSLNKIGSQKSRITDGIVRGVGGLVNALPRMWNNSPWYAKGLLVYSSGIFATPAMEVGAGYVYTNPIETMAGIDTIYGGIRPEPPVTPEQLIGNRINTWIIQPLFGN